MDVIAVCSGKGGVGKTTTSASLATSFAQRGLKVAVIDFDVGLRNLDLVMGCEKYVVYDLVNVMSGEVPLMDALVKDARFPELYVLAAPQTSNKSDLNEEDLEGVFAQFESQGFDKVICDSPAGMDKGFQLAIKHADSAIMVVNAEISSLRDADRMLGVMNGRTQRGTVGAPLMDINAIVTRYRPLMVQQGTMVGVDDIQELLGIRVIGIIPESLDVLAGSNAGTPVAMQEKSKAGMAYKDTVARMEGETKPFRFILPVEEKKGWFAFGKEKAA